MENNNIIQIETVRTISIKKWQNFWKAIQLSIIKPHTIKRQLAGANQIAIFKCGVDETTSKLDFFKQIALQISKHSDLQIDADFVPKIFSTINSEIKLENLDSKYMNNTDLDDEHSGNILLVLNKLINKKLKSDSFELVVVGKISNDEYFTVFK